MKALELRKMSDGELEKRIQEETQNLSNLHFQKVIGQLENPMKLVHIRKDIARMKTLLQERKLKQPSPPAAPVPTKQDGQ